MERKLFLFLVVTLFVFGYSCFTTTSYSKVALSEDEVRYNIPYKELANEKWSGLFMSEGKYYVDNTCLSVQFDDEPSREVTGIDTDKNDTSCLFLMKAKPVIEPYEIKYVYFSNKRIAFRNTLAFKAKNAEYNFCMIQNNNEEGFLENYLPSCSEKRQLVKKVVRYESYSC